MRNNPNWLKFIRDQYSPGTRIRLIQMDDPYAPIPSGTEGTVDFVDDAGQIHMKWDNGRSLALIPGEDSFSKITPSFQMLKLYMPLTVTQYEQDEWGSWDEHPSELDEDTTLAYQDQILAAILKERMPEETERGLMKYYHENDSVNEKVQSLFFTVEQIGDRLMGVAECRVQGDLSNVEIAQLKEYVTGQASDGFGEGFEQRPIKVSDGEIYVSLWNSDKNWSIMTQEELSNSQQMGGLQFG